jgi:hypothetical protein
MIGYALIAIFYAIVLIPLAFLLARTLETLSRADRSAEVYEGIATSCIVAVCAGLLLTRGLGVQPSILAWTAFIIVCGVTIWLPPPLRLRDVLACATAPSLALLGTLLAVYLIPAWLFGIFGAVASTTTAVSPEISSLRALLFTLFVSLVSIPAIAVAIYARNHILGVSKALYGADPAALGRLEKVVNSALRIGAALAAVFVVLR